MLEAEVDKQPENRTVLHPETGEMMPVHEQEMSFIFGGIDV
jgi:hypothetical protein